MLVQKLWAKAEAFYRSEDGATAIEYGLIAAGIAVAISAAVFAFGSSLSKLFSDVGTSIGGVNTTVGGGT